MNFKNRLIKFDDIFSIPLGLYRTIGLEPFHGAFDQKITTRIFLRIIFHLGTWNLVVVVVFELFYLIRAMNNFSTFLEATAIAPCIIFCFKSLGKVVTVGINKTKLTVCINRLRNRFPKTKIEQKIYHVPMYKVYADVPFTIMCMICIWFFNMYELCESIYRYYFENLSFGRNLPYYAWYPFSLEPNWVYALVYVQQCLAGYVAACQILATDFVMYIVIKQIVMHYDSISRQLEAMVPTGKGKDRIALKQLIRHHIEILKISDETCAVFNSSLLFNFLSSTIILCLTVFQITMGVSKDMKYILKYVWFLSYELLNIFIVCYYGNMLIESSYQVGQSAYNQNWFAADIQYKKDLLFVLSRAQKPSSFYAISFSVVSMEGFNKIISKAYQFYAVLRTVYNR